MLSTRTGIKSSDERDEAEQLAKDEYCDGCKGQALFKYDSTCTETCEGFKNDVEQTLKDWAATK